MREGDRQAGSAKLAPQSFHSIIQAFLAERINRATAPDKVAFAFPELRTTYGGRSYVPDIAVYRWDRIPKDSHGRPLQQFDALPDVVVEIASPGQSTNFLTRRCVWYVAQGSPVAVLVDPQDESVMVFRADRAPIGLQRGEVLERPELMTGFSISIDELFSALTFD